LRATAGTAAAVARSSSGSGCKVYVGSGDSVAAGADLLTGSAYPHHLLLDHLLQDPVLRRAYALSCFVSVAESGASTDNYLAGGKDLYEPPGFHTAQLSRVVGRQPDLVTVTAGADDLVLPTLLQTCLVVILRGAIASPAPGVGCVQRVLDDTAAWQHTRQNLTTILQGYARWGAANRPNLVVAVTDYYNPMPTQLNAAAISKSCALPHAARLPSFLGAGAQALCERYFANVSAAFPLIDATIQRLNSVIAQAVGPFAAATHGKVTVVDLYAAFQGHCTSIALPYFFGVITGNLGCGDSWVAPSHVALSTPFTLGPVPVGGFTLPAVTIRAVTVGDLIRGGVHPTDRGQACIADLIWEKVKAQLGSQERPVLYPCAS
jgi:lysophospholipase L1-like esterase